MVNSLCQQNRKEIRNAEKEKEKVSCSLLKWRCFSDINSPMTMINI